MAKSKPTVAREVERYLRTGDTDMLCAAWPGGGLFERGRRAHQDLRGALVVEVSRLAGSRPALHFPTTDAVALTRSKVEPMVRGLFVRAEQDAVLATLEKSVVFLTSENIASVIVQESFDGEAWTLANLYLASLGAPLLGKKAMRLVGLSQGTSCFVTPSCLIPDDPFSDFIVHEAAHVFHNCKRKTLGLRETRTKEWLLDIDYVKRETFAYSCEAYARVLARSTSAAQRRALAAEYGAEVRISERRVDPAEVADIVQAAAASRNGWKIILARCAPAKRSPSALKAAEFGLATGREAKL